LGQIHPPRAASACTHSPLRLLKQLAQKRMLQPGFVHTMDAFRAGWRHQWLRGKARQSALQRRRRRRCGRAQRGSTPIRSGRCITAAQAPESTRVPHAARHKHTHQDDAAGTLVLALPLGAGGVLGVLCPSSAPRSCVASMLRLRGLPRCRCVAGVRASEGWRADMRGGARGEVRVTGQGSASIGTLFRPRGMISAAGLASKRAPCNLLAGSGRCSIRSILPSLTRRPCAVQRIAHAAFAASAWPAPACAGWLPRARAARPAAAPP
jgi:hypothetical protein